MALEKKLAHIFFERTENQLFFKLRLEKYHFRSIRTTKSISSEEVFVGCKILKSQRHFIQYTKDNVSEDIFIL